jgi:hypothetical protein
MTLRDINAPWAGLAAGPLAWLLSFQGNYLLVGWQCAGQIRVVPVIAVVLALASILGSYLSWRSYRRPIVEPSPEDRAGRLIAGVGAAMGLLFALGILLQAYAGVVLSGCER